ncbi:fatty acid-binding protein, intestinal-like [Lingula anatina]|uniref:Fatty acid-binding protein, intestinal-like n=1 Tax=Lingula anatina TaxID=7574 RepID=A0A1S3HRA6_LINAN|nr:fatty acid-binding protein, intestinal-like [Lingula anatina]XP_013389645.1 fatty acid-binding protein, intestinal-like [Lingula anatina]|eukprot:XP_013387579.1 fatty acid-binding protein, intestinal-like [Lingula anatina]
MAEAEQQAAPEGDSPSVDFSGMWKLDRSENFEDFLKENGANIVARKMAGLSKPTQEIKQEGNKFVIKTQAGFWTQEQSFTVGDSFQQDHQGTTMTCSTRWEGNKLITDLVPNEEGKGKKTKNTRELVGDELVQTMEVGNVVCKRIFKKLPPS